MKKIILFPFHPDLRTLIDHKDKLRGFQISGFISFKEDVDLIRSLNQALGLEEMSYEQLLCDCDAVILLDNYRDYKSDKYYRVIEDAISQEKDIFVTPLAQSQLDLENYKGKYQLLECLPNNMESIEKEFNHIPKVRMKLYEINIPVIGVLGQGKHCDKFENQLLFKEVLEEEYETIAMTTNSLGALFGCYTMPSFLYEGCTFEEKVIKFNYYIRKISTQDDPDVLVLGIPEGITPFERHEFHHFSEYPFIVTSAVSIDMVVLCTYFMRGSAVERTLKTISEFCCGRFNIPIDAIAISRTVFEVPIEEYQKIIFEFLDEPFLQKYYPDTKHVDLPMINMFDWDEAKAVIKRSLIRLKENVNVI